MKFRLGINRHLHVPATLVVLAGLAACGCESSDAVDVVEVCVNADDCRWMQLADCMVADCVDGSCVAAADPQAEGDTCGLANPCLMAGGTCQAGVCTGAKPVICPLVDCMVGSCDPDSGECVYHQGPDGVACDLDANECTKDECSGGVCKAGPNNCPCRIADDCPARSDLCAGRYDCTRNVCVVDPMTAVVCPADGPCHTFSCNGETGQCERAEKDDGTECSAADACNFAGTCTQGACLGRPRCDDGNSCTDNVCDIETGACSYPPGSGSCDDGDQCTGPDSCAQGRCAGPALSCADSLDCTVDSCVPGTGCVNAPADLGTPCVDADPCTVESVCDGLGACLGGRPKCDDDNQCTSDSCAATTGTCSHVDLVAGCDDGNPCTTGEACNDGVCSGGTPVPGCCNFDQDCEDDDLCTESTCADSVCVHHGEPEGLCGNADGCSVSWCRASTGDCMEFDAGFPVSLFSWDFTDGDGGPGFSWGSPAGSFVVGGLAAGTGPASVLLPLRYIPDGIISVWVGLFAGSCDQIDFSRKPVASECAVIDGRASLVAVFDDAAKLDGRLDLSMTVAPGAVVANTKVFLWAVPGCERGALAVPETGSALDLALEAATGQAAVVYNVGSHMSSAVTALEGGLVSARFAQDDYGVVAGRFSTSITQVADGWVAAWGGADNRVWLGGLTRDGRAGSAFMMPDVEFEEEVQAWPSLATDSAGRPVVAFAYGSITDFDIALAVIDGMFGNPRVVSSVRVNESVTGSRTRPSLIIQGGRLAAAWMLEVDNPEKRYVYKVTDLGSDFHETGLDVSLGSQGNPISGAGFIHSASNYFCIWQKADGGIGGAVLDSQTLGLLHSFDIGGLVRSRPLILPHADGAVVISIAGSGATASVVAEAVSPTGTVSPAQVIAAPVLASLTSIAASRFGPLMYLLAFTDHLAAQPGIRLVPFFPRCAGGFVADSAACTGIGESGRDGGALQ